ncbi:MAG: hypothetical protein ACTHN5_08685 [Phycisphaerae bacterium]
MTSGEVSEATQSRMISVVLPAPHDGQVLLAQVQRMHGALHGFAHEFLVICDAPALEMIDALPTRPPAMRVVEQTDHDAGGYAEGFRAAAGDVVVTLNPSGADDVAAIPAMVRRVREEHCAVVACRGHRRSIADWALFVLAGIDPGNVESQFRAYDPAFVDWQRVESVHAETVGIELTVKANLQECPLGEVRATKMGQRTSSLRPVARWVGLALQSPLLVWSLWWAMIAAAMLEVSYHPGGATLGDVANVALLAAAAFAFTIAARRVRHRMRVADGFFSLVLLNPLLYHKAQPFDHTLLSTGLLGLMAGAIIAMNRNNVARYFAVMALALLLTWLSPDFLMLLPALALWIIAAGYLICVKPSPPATRARGFVVMAAGEIGLLIFGIACLLEEARPTPSPDKLFQQIVGLLDFPLIVLGIVVVGLGWRAGPRGTTPPHFAGVLALLLGLLTMLLNNFGAGELSRPGADQTVLLVCMLYVVFSLHGPRRLRWIIPPALLIAAAAYTVFR